MIPEGQVGARGPNRTGMSLRTADFESAASTNSATRAISKSGSEYNFGCDPRGTLGIITRHMTRLTDIDSDPTLVARAQAGERQAMAEIYRRYSAAARIVVYRLISRRALAEDLHQDTFVEVLQRLRELRDPRALGVWIRSIAISKCLMHLRSPWHRSAVWLDQVAGGWTVPGEFADTDEYPDAAAGRRLERAMRRLPATARAVVWLHDVEEITHEEIGQLFGHTASFSKSQLVRAHQRLRQLLERDAERLSCTQISQSF